MGGFSVGSRDDSFKIEIVFMIFFKLEGNEIHQNVFSVFRQVLNTYKYGYYAYTVCVWMYMFLDYFLYNCIFAAWHYIHAFLDCQTPCQQSANSYRVSTLFCFINNYSATVHASLTNGVAVVVLGFSLPVSANTIVVSAISIFCNEFYPKRKILQTLSENGREAQKITWFPQVAWCLPICFFREMDDYHFCRIRVGLASEKINSRIAPLLYWNTMKQFRRRSHMNSSSFVRDCRPFYIMPPGSRLDDCWQ